MNAGRSITATLLESAARLQEVVPDALLVRESAAVVADLSQRYAEILEAVEVTEGWVTSIRASSPPLTLLGSLDGVEAGLRQLRRTHPLEVEQVTLGGGKILRVPTLEEMLRIRAYLVVQRNQVRDYLDVVALAARLGAEAPVVLHGIDEYYEDRSRADDSVQTVLVQRLSQPAPRDTRVTAQLSSYKGLDPRWHQWSDVVSACTTLADAVLEQVERQ